MGALVPEQLSLPVQLPDDETFSSFVSGVNVQVVSYLEQLFSRAFSKDHPFLTFLSGETGCGKSHLLYSLCHKAANLGYSHVYISLKQKNELSEQVLQGLENVQLVCIDDVQCLSGEQSWQIALFDLINRVKESNNGCHLVITADAGPTQVGLELPDLRSRLSWGVSFHLQPLDDDERIQALINRAKSRGMVLSEDVARFLMTHLQRDMPSLMGALDELDNSSLKEQRRLTIPFIKHVLQV